LYKLGLSPHHNQKLSIKLEIDQNPPTGYNCQLTMLNKDFLVAVNHFDLPSLFAGKLHAVLCRPYAKGRDYYDLLWFLAKKIVPNYVLLNNALQQTEGTKANIDSSELKKLLLTTIESADFPKIRNDVVAFLLEPNEIRFFEKDYFVSAINSLP